MARVFFFSTLKWSVTCLRPASPFRCKRWSSTSSSTVYWAAADGVGWSRTRPIHLAFLARPTSGYLVLLQDSCGFSGIFPFLFPLFGIIFYCVVFWEAATTTRCWMVPLYGLCILKSPFYRVLPVYFPSLCWISITDLFRHFRNRASDRTTQRGNVPILGKLGKSFDRGPSINERIQRKSWGKNRVPRCYWLVVMETLAITPRKTPINRD